MGSPPIADGGIVFDTQPPDALGRTRWFLQELDSERAVRSRRCEAPLRHHP